MNTRLLSLGLSLLLSVSVATQEASVPPRLSLREALHLAEAHSPRLAADQQLTAIARADVKNAGRRPSLMLSVGGEGYPLFQHPLPSFWNDQNLMFRVDREFETAGRRGLRLELADAGVSVAQAEVDESRRRLRMDVSRAYLGLVLAQSDREVATTALAELERIIGLTQARVSAGEVAGAELRRLEVERLRFIDDVFSAELGARNARASLLGLLNALDLSQPVEAIDSLTAPPLVTPDGHVVATMNGLTAELADLRSLALANRPDIRAARLEQSRAETEIRRQRALGRPNITAGWGYRRHFGANTMDFGVTVPLPVFHRLNPGGAERAEARHRRTEALAELAARDVEVELQQAINAVEINAERVRYVERDYLVNAQESLDITQASYELGAADLIDFLDAQRAFRETQLTHNNALYALRISLVNLEAVLGLPMSTGETP